MTADQLGGHVLLVHPPGHHDGDLDSGVHCMFCEGGLSACTRCGAFEGAWPDECPGEEMGHERSDQVHRGELNYRDGTWRPGECCRVMRPVHDKEAFMAEQGYRYDGERWVKA